VLPDLRWTPLLSSAEAFKKPVIEGSRLKQGMPDFGKVLGPEYVELVRAYLVGRAIETYPKPAAAAAPTAAAAPAAAAPAK
jgi:hypothetical protein